MEKTVGASLSDCALTDLFYSTVIHFNNFSQVKGTCSHVKSAHVLITSPLFRT
jgi:hypothetical protein